MGALTLINFYEFRWHGWCDQRSAIFSRLHALLLLLRSRFSGELASSLILSKWATLYFILFKNSELSNNESYINSALVARDVIVLSFWRFELIWSSGGTVLYTRIRGRLYYTWSYKTRNTKSESAGIWEN